jgi:hypothetical protein
MNDIDFIPDWYRTGRQRKVSYRRQYTMILCLFGVLAVWSFVSGLSVSRGRAEVDRREQTYHADESISARFEGLKKELAVLMDKQRVLGQVDPRADFGAALAELSHVGGERIILRLLDVQSEKYVPDKREDKPSMMTLGSDNSESKSILPGADLRYRFKVAGIAADAADVATLISALEKSSYFCQILPGFSKTIQVKDFPVTEFEVSCYLANYSSMK